MSKNIGLSSSHEIELLKSAVFPPLICHYARQNDIASLENLRITGANLSGVDCSNTTALHIAAELGHLTMVQYLLKWGASVHAKSVLKIKFI